MRRHRTTAVGIFASLLIAGLAAAASSPASGKQHSAVPPLVFPLVAKTDLWDNYGDPRPNGRHAGIDMENPWRAPVLAVEEEASSTGIRVSAVACSTSREPAARRTSTST
jgi:hypothetical protein